MSSTLKVPRRNSVSPQPWTHVHLAVFVMAIGSLLTLSLGILLYLFISLDIPDLKTLRQYRPLVTSFVLDARGEVVDRIFEQNRTVVPYDRMPEQLVLAFIAAEDSRFFEHSGLDGWSILRALFHNLRSGDRGQGGSTITQQVARALLLSPEKTYLRKLKEAILAYRIDSALSKEEILHIYLNQIYLGGGAYGVEAAAQTYFGKHVWELNLAETSLLAGLPQAPSRYSPLRYFRRAKKRQVYVLNRMAEEGYITPTKARQAFKQGLFWAPPRQVPKGGEYFLQQVRREVERLYGRERLRTGGLVIHTTLDRELQKAAALAVEEGVAQWRVRHLDSEQAFSPPQIALAAVEVGTGKVLAVMGGTNFAASQFDRAIQGRRQPGSAFKPVIYAAALASGFTPATLINDAPLRLAGTGPGTYWEPHNFNGRFQGPTTLRNGLIHSNNIVTIKLLREIGTGPVAGLAKKMGIRTPLAPNLSLALGSSEVSLLELTAAYTVFAAGGSYFPPYFISRIENAEGRTLSEHQPRLQPVLDEMVAFQMNHLLKGVIAEGTGKRARPLGIPAAGKTGTTDQYMDAWFIGYTPDLATGVWLGYDQKISLGEGETGGRAAAPIWLEFMRRCGSSLSGREFPVPTGITFAPMNALTGELGRPEAGEGQGAAWEAFRKEQLHDPGPGILPRDL